MLGLYISSHPLQFLKDSLEGQTTTRIADIPEMREGEMVKIGGLLSACRRFTTRKGDMMLVATIEDLSGNIGLIVFPKTYDKAAALLNDDQVIVVRGKVNRDIAVNASRRESAESRRVAAKLLAHCIDF
jgi:DNA polymerase-3 subunit alpha